MLSDIPTEIVDDRVLKESLQRSCFVNARHAFHCAATIVVWIEIATAGMRQNKTELKSIFFLGGVSV